MKSVEIKQKISVKAVSSDKVKEKYLILNLTLQFINFSANRKGNPPKSYIGINVTEQKIKKNILYVPSIPFPEINGVLQGRLFQPYDSLSSAIPLVLYLNFVKLEL